MYGELGMGKNWWWHISRSHHDIHLSMWE